MTDNAGDMEILGLDELDRKLGLLDDKLAGKALYSALGFALTPVVKEAKTRASKADEPHTMTYPNGKTVDVDPGLLKSAIRKRRVPKKEMVGEFATGAAMGVYIGKGTKQKVYPNYWHFIEYGTPTFPAAPFIRPAFDNNVELMLERFGDKLNQNIDKYLE